MTYDDFCNIREDLIEAYNSGELTETQLDTEMEELQEYWEEYGEGNG